MSHLAYDFGLFQAVIGELGFSLNQKTMKTACGRRVPANQIADESYQVDCKSCIDVAIDHYKTLYRALHSIDMSAYSDELILNRKEALDNTLDRFKLYLGLKYPRSATKRQELATQRLLEAIFNEPMGQ